ncbi:hypothetical protein [Flavobacterium sp.]|jgi:hypothetical protein|uniref:hypothetical protein n=1 Tax=Flavobacterium sp. TaxID=239 RepID=UPI0037BE55E2
MIRARFKVAIDDPRPIHWPLKHPYWVSGYGDGYMILVAYADNEEEILKNWPEAEHIDSTEVEQYNFTSRFPQPSWFNIH